MRLIDMDSHFAPADEFDYVPDDLRYLTPAWLAQGQGKVGLVLAAGQEQRRGGTLVPHKRFAGDFDIEARLKDMDAMGIEKQLLNPEFGQYQFEIEPRLASEMCRSANYAIGKELKAHPD